MAAELDARESLYESERNKINVTVGDLKSELNQVEMQVTRLLFLMQKCTNVFFSSPKKTSAVVRMKTSHGKRYV